MWLWLLALILLFILCVLVLMPLNLEVYYRHRGQDNHLSLVISTWFGVKYHFLSPGRRPIPVLRLRAGMKGTQDPAPEKEKRSPPGGPVRTYLRLITYFRLGKRFWPALEFLLHRTELRRLEWRTLVGLPDAAYTGMAVGGLWSLKGMVLSILYRLISKTSTLPEVAVVPHFTGPSFGLLIHCIFTIRIGHIMVTAIKIALVFIRDALWKALPLNRLLKG